MTTEKPEMTSSINRPAWVSTPEHGGLLAFKHRHRRSEVEVDHYGHTTGLSTRREAAEVWEN
jgi:hypothetical protein